MHILIFINVFLFYFILFLSILHSRQLYFIKHHFHLFTYASAWEYSFSKACYYSKCKILFLALFTRGYCSFVFIKINGFSFLCMYIRVKKNFQIKKIKTTLTSFHQVNVMSWVLIVRSTCL
jgi:hypothetical protein